MLSFRLAFRYFFSTKRLHSVQIISTISSITVGIVVMAAVCILSIFNGYERILLNQVSFLDPPLLVKRSDEQVFSSNHPELQKVLSQTTSLEHYSFCLQTQGAIRSSSGQRVAHLYGVDSIFTQVNNLKPSAFIGDFIATKDQFSLGIELYGSLFPPSSIQEDSLEIYIPKRKGFINPMLPNTAFRRLSGEATSVINVQNEHYDQSLFLDIKALRSLLDYTSSEVDRVLLLPRKDITLSTLQQELQNHLGSEWRVLNRLEQQPNLIRLVAIEKWMSFFILFFVLLLATFNVICSSSMLIIEKKRDIDILRFLGGSSNFIHRVFLIQGLLITLLGAFIGFFLGLLFVFLQDRWGWISYGEGLYKQPYPVAIQSWDILVLLLTILAVAYLSSLYPVHRLLRKK